MVRTEKGPSGKYRYIHTLECKVCSSLYERIGANKSPLPNAYCSKECRQEWFSKQRRLSHCEHCSKEFYQIYEGKKFCSKECYSANMREYPEKYNLVEKAKHANTFSNTSESIEKGLQKKLDKGLIIDWTDASWKQFWRRCNELTRRRRVELMDEWNGYDYIDGEYIKPYLELHYSHKKYPTLDHVIPRSEYYKQGKSPQEACRPENLKWTKRTNNSKKYNKT
jgi:hypothetical protein